MAAAELSCGQGIRPEDVRRRQPGVANPFELTASHESFTALLDHLPLATRLLGR